MVKLPQLVQESESLSPLVCVVFTRRICHFCNKKGSRKKKKKIQFKKKKKKKRPTTTTIRGSSLSLRDPGARARPGISHGEGLA